MSSSVVLICLQVVIFPADVYKSALFAEHICRRKYLKSAAPLFIPSRSPDEAEESARTQSILKQIKLLFTYSSAEVTCSRSSNSMSKTHQALQLLLKYDVSMFPSKADIKASSRAVPVWCHCLFVWFSLLIIQSPEQAEKHFLSVLFEIVSSIWKNNNPEE